MVYPQKSLPFPAKIIAIQIVLFSAPARPDGVSGYG
jgi:hypothetical protein